jgi:hypothetical protein
MAGGDEPPLLQHDDAVERTRPFGHLLRAHAPLEERGVRWRLLDSLVSIRKGAQPP